MSEKKEFVVVKDGQRQSGLLSEEEAKRKAQQMQQQINEKAGKNESGNVAVKQNLFG